MAPRYQSRHSSSSIQHHTAFRGAGRPSWVSLTTATVIAAAAVASGVVAGPPRTLAVTGHLTTVADVSPRNRASAAHRPSLLGGYEASAETVQAIAAPLAMAAAAPAIAAAPVIADWPARGHRGKRAGQARSSPGGSASGPAATPASTASTASPASGQPAPAPSQPAAPEQPLQFYDSVIPWAIPAGNVIATYATGRYAVMSGTVAGRPTIWIDTQGSDPGASVLDVEPGDATPARAAIWAAQKLAQDPSARARLYTMRSEWPAVQAAISMLPAWMQARVRWWIADPTGVPHMVPGANATQWYWGRTYDISTANPGF